MTPTPRTSAESRLLAQLLRLLRTATDRSQLAVATDAGVSATTVVAAEREEPRADDPNVARISFYKLCLHGLRLVDQPQLFRPLLELYGEDEREDRRLLGNLIPGKNLKAGRSELLREVLARWEHHKQVSPAQAVTERGRVAGEVVMYLPDAVGARALDADLERAERAPAEMLTWSALPSAVILESRKLRGEGVSLTPPLNPVGWKSEHVRSFSARVAAFEQQVLGHEDLLANGRRSILSRKEIERYLTAPERVDWPRGPWLLDGKWRRAHIEALANLLSDSRARFDVRLDDERPPQELHLAGLEGAVLRAEPMWGHSSQSIPSESRWLLLKLMLDFETRWEALSRSQSRESVAGTLRELLAQPQPLKHRYRDQL